MSTLVAEYVASVASEKFFYVKCKGFFITLKNLCPNKTPAPFRRAEFPHVSLA